MLLWLYPPKETEPRWVEIPLFREDRSLAAERTVAATPSGRDRSQMRKGTEAPRPSNGHRAQTGNWSCCTSYSPRNRGILLDPLSSAILGQQLPPLPKFTGDTQGEEERFDERLEVVALVYRWNNQAKLVNLITHLRGSACLLLLQVMYPQQRSTMYY